MTTGLPLCADCWHFHSEDVTGNKCDAFPSGIPDKIFLLEVDHHKPYLGDHGIQFEPLPADTEDD